MKLLFLALVMVVAAGGCGGKKAPSKCGPAVEESLDPGRTRHLLPRAPEPRYLGNPPTSAPHLGGPPPTGVQHQRLAPPVQVGVLESGGVLVQHRGCPRPTAVSWRRWVTTRWWP